MTMKPIEKYQMKFIELLKEAEEELGGPLTVTVRDRVTISEGRSGLLSTKNHEYHCSIGTEGMSVLY